MYKPRLMRSLLIQASFMTLLFSCSNKGQIQYSPIFENSRQLSEANVCSEYPNGFSSELSAITQANQTEIERRTTALLTKYVTKTGTVKYAELFDSAVDKTELNSLTASFASSLSLGIPFSAQEKSAWINLYNLATLQLIVKNYENLTGDQDSAFPDVKSIQNIDHLGSEVWNIKNISTNRGLFSLNDLEKELQKTKDPRIHFAINCASKGCPALLASAYVAFDLNSQLNERTCAFINSGERTVFDNLDPRTPVAYVSSIFNWYSEDFGNIYQFMNKYLSNKNKTIADTILLKSSAGENLWKIEYDFYDWELNEDIP